QLLCNPKQDDRALIDEFLEGYYGPAAAPHLRQYLALLHDASRGHNLTCNSATDAPFLKFKHLAQADQLWQKAAQASASAPEFLPQIRLGRLPILYVALKQWTQLRNDCTASGEKWPWPASRKLLAQEWSDIAKGVPAL